MAEEKTLLDLIPELPDTQCAWVILAMCAVPRANHLLRSTPPTQIQEYAQGHDNELWLCLNKLLGTTEEAAADTTNERRNMATLPARLGGLGLRSAERTSTAAYWAGYCDALKVLKEKRPALAERFLGQLERPAEEQPACMREATEARRRLQAAGFEEMPSWREAAEGTVTPSQPRDTEAGEWPHGWQFHASSVLEHNYRTIVILPPATPQRQALIRSQSGYAAGKWLTTTPKNPQTTLSPLRMQVALRFRLHFSLPLGPQRCNGRSCRALLDPYGYHWASCNRSGRLKLRSKPLERTWATVFREAGARVQTDVLLRNTNLEQIAANDGRQLEVVATGLPLWRGVPLGVDATMVSPLHADGTPWAGEGRGDNRTNAATHDGVAIVRGEREKIRKYPELVNNARLRLTTLANETGGRWSTTCTKVIRLLAKAKARNAPEDRRGLVAAAWASRWWGMLSIAGRNALAATLVDDKPQLLDGCDCEEPSWHEVLLEGALEPPAPELDKADTDEGDYEQEENNPLEVAVAHA